MIALIDYDAGNMKSVEKALQLIGEDVLVTRDPKEILAADKVVLPGVGSFGDAMENLHHFGLVPVIHQVVQEQTPFLGICLGLQLLFEKSEESPGVEGLGILKGEILRIPAAEGLKIPHMGWNNIRFPNKGRLFAGVPEDAYVYFVHSYYLKAQDNTGFAEELNKLSQQPQYYEQAVQMSRKGNDFYSEEHVLSMWRDFYHGLLGESQRRQNKPILKKVFSVAAGGVR